MSKKMTLYFIVPFIILIGIIAILIIPPKVHDYRLSHFSKQLYSYGLPASTRLIEKQELCGKLYGNGNGMDYMASILVKSKLTIGQLEDYYRDNVFHPVKGKGKVVLEVIPMTSNTLDSQYVENRRISYDYVEGIVAGEGYYVVLIYDGGYNAYFDLRGN